MEVRDVFLLIKFVCMSMSVLFFSVVPTVGPLQTVNIATPCTVQRHSLHATHHKTSQNQASSHSNLSIDQKKQFLKPHFLLFPQLRSPRLTASSSETCQIADKLENVGSGMSNYWLVVSAPGIEYVPWTWSLQTCTYDNVYFQ